MIDSQAHGQPLFSLVSPLHLPYISPISPLYLPYISPERLAALAHARIEAAGRALRPVGEAHLLG